MRWVQPEKFQGTTNVLPQNSASMYRRSETGFSWYDHAVQKKAVLLESGAVLLSWHISCKSQVIVEVEVRNYAMGLDGGCAILYLNTHYRAKQCKDSFRIALGLCSCTHRLAKSVFSAPPFRLSRIWSTSFVLCSFPPISISTSCSLFALLCVSTFPIQCYSGD